MALTHTAKELELATQTLNGRELSTTERYYETHAAEYARRTLTADMSLAYSRFLPNIPVGGRILDVGCGAGRDLRVFSERGYRVTGIDSSRVMAEIAGKYSGAPCFVMRVEEMTFVQCFEGIWACASLLHAPKDILPIALHRIHDALTPNGIMFASVQEGEGEGKAHDGRFFAYYQFQEFKAVVSDADFAIESAWENEDALGRPSQFRWLNVIARRRG